ncbi:MAG: carboxypeptidase-like regulatory domain-containing protein [Candidatus Delongbacteria bacterium]|nr:carboxypeptidase-like regulatory domain-containing protein [Candidatus Delongbacteria bacterium]MCG2759884.1 carboxypeptidase-like regulatory domain-containing protein [Candidatus Delongbacteria bacterium]
MKLILTLLLIILTGSLFSSGMIKGNVLSIEDEPMTETNITIIGTNQGSASDDAGNYFIRGVKPGRYILKCSYVGFRDEIERGVTVYNDSVTVIDFLMIPVEYQLAGIEVRQNKDDFNSLLYFKDLAKTELIEIKNIGEPKLKGRINVKTKPGFWEMFRYYMHNMFN